MGENIRDKQLQFTETLVNEWCLSACSCFAARSGYVFLSFSFWFSRSEKLRSRFYRSCYRCHIINRYEISSVTRHIQLIGCVWTQFAPRWNPSSSIVSQSQRLSINILENDRWCDELRRARNKVAAYKTEENGFGLPLWLHAIEKRTTKEKINVSETR